MICAYASGSHPYIYLQRGYRNYGIPNVIYLGHSALANQIYDSHAP